MKVTHNGTEYNVSKLACGYEWRLTDVNNPRSSIVLNADQMALAGLPTETTVIDLGATQAAQSKAAIAQYLGDDVMWQQAKDKYLSATGRALH